MASRLPAMAQVDDILFGKGKREQFFKEKDASEVRVLHCGLSAAAG